MRIGLDIDGVLASFNPAYQRRVIEMTGRDLFPGTLTDAGPPTWNFPEHYGYTREEVSRVWDTIHEDSMFWLNLPPMEGMDILKLLWPTLQRDHDVYFITARSGIDAKKQTEIWLMGHLGLLDQLSLPAQRTPTVILSSDKGVLAGALDLECFLEDRRRNAENVCNHSPDTRSYLLNRNYNTGRTRATRVNSVGEFFDHELSRL